MSDKNTMSEKKNNSGHLTPRDTELAILAWRALKNPEIDWEKLVEIGGFKNVASARACFQPVKKKLQEGSATATPTKGATKRQLAQDDNDDNPTPTKKPRGRPKKTTTAPATKPEAATTSEEDGADTIV